MSAPTYPVKVKAQLDAGLSSWLWLVKCLLALPHYIILASCGWPFVLSRPLTPEGASQAPVPSVAGPQQEPPGCHDGETQV
jgi:hypothetical protein